jgi:hypothetical protein
VPTAPTPSHGPLADQGLSKVRATDQNKGSGANSFLKAQLFFILVDSLQIAFGILKRV